MNKDIESLLEAREKRHSHAVNLSLDLDKVVTVAKVNMPGIGKNTAESGVVLNIMTRLLRSLFDARFHTRVPSPDGDYHIFVLEEDVKKVKRVMVYLEKTHPLGRLMDLDVYTAGRGFSRSEIGMNPRKCFLCDKDAFLCAREKTHSLKEMNAHIVSKVRGFLLDALTKESEHALLKELYLSPCFSLVGPAGSKLHKDMNISHFLSSIQALKPYFRHYLAIGMDLNRHYHTLRKTGLQGEKAMFEATGGVNTHKGAHFIFGLTLPVFMDCVLNGASFESFKDALKAMASVLLKEDFKTLKTPLTTGEMLYLNHGVEGIRGEALRGFPGVFEWYPKKDESGFEKLLRIMARIDDTTLLKRDIDIASMKKALLSCENKGFKGLDDIAGHYSHASPGGAADLLALVYFLEASDHLLK